nr:hypothetical protein [Tanacetum cinerariifolium]
MEMEMEMVMGMVMEVMKKDYFYSFFIISSIAVQTPDSGISNLLAVGTTFTGNGNLYCQWELSPDSGNALSGPTLLPVEIIVAGGPAVGMKPLQVGTLVSPASTLAASIEIPGNISKTQSKATPNEPSSLGTSSGGGPRRQDTMRDTIAQTRSENVSKSSNDPLLVEVNTPRSGEDRDYKFEKEVKILEKKRRSRTHGLKRLYKVGLSARIEFSADEESLGEEDVCKQRRIYDIDANQDIYLVNVHRDKDIFGVNDHDDTSMFNVDKDLQGEEVVKKKVAGKDVSVVEEINAASIATSITAIAPTISMDEITLAKSLIEIKTSKTKVKGIVMQEPSETPTPTSIVSSQQPSKVQEKGKGIMVEPKMPLKKKAQISLDEEFTFKLQAEEDEQERIVREKAQQIKEVNLA